MELLNSWLRRITPCGACAVALDLFPFVVAWLAGDGTKLAWLLALVYDFLWLAFSVRMLRRPSLAITTPVFVLIHARNLFVA